LSQFVQISVIYEINVFAMFLVFCETDHSYLIIQENKAIFEDGVKKGDEIQFFHCNKMYTGCIIGRSGTVYNLNINLY